MAARSKYLKALQSVILCVILAGKSNVGTLTIVSGPNDCVNEASEDDYRRLLEVSTQHANKVIVSTIPPVMDKPAR